MALKEVTVFQGQNLKDIALQEYGVVEAVFSLMEDNEFISTIDHVLKPGDIVRIDPDKIVRQDIVNFYLDNGIRINTGEDTLPFAEFNDDFNCDFFI